MGREPPSAASESNSAPEDLGTSPPDSATGIDAVSGVKVTLWRVLNSMVIFVFGVVKSVNSFQNGAIVANSFDLVLGVVWTLMYVYHCSIRYVYYYLDSDALI